MMCANCNSEIQMGSRFCSACGIRLTPAYGSVHEAAAREGLVRPREGRAIAGVCAGFARRYGWDVVVVRLVLALAVIFGCGTPFLAYIIAWIVMPNEPFTFNVPLVVPTTAPEAGQPQV
jgi:phage shock protein C